MSNKERIILKTEYKCLKEEFKTLRSAALRLPYGSKEHNEAIVELSECALELHNIKRALYETSFRKQYIDYILGKLFLGEEKSTGGR